MAKNKIPAWVRTIWHLQKVVSYKIKYDTPEMYVSMKLFNSIGEFNIKPATAERKLRELKSLYKKLNPDKTQPRINRKEHIWIFPRGFYDFLQDLVRSWEKIKIKEAYEAFEKEDL